MAEPKSAQKNLPFAGYENLQSNYVYTPNQFFDVVLPHSDRGCLRIVAYLIRRQLGYMTAKGEPQEPIVGVSQRELIAKAKVSAGAIAPALRKAIDLNFIELVRKGRSHQKGACGETALYTLKWDEEADQYETNIDRFQGFYAKDGNRTPIPNQFFDVAIRQEVFGVSCVIGMVIRHSIGFTTKFGSRVQQTALSLDRISELAKIGRSTTKRSLKKAMEEGHIICVEKGVFDSRTVVRKANVYKVNWADSDRNVSKMAPSLFTRSAGVKNETSQKWPQENASEMAPETSQKWPQRNVSKMAPLKRNKVKETFKQQQDAVAVEEVWNEKFVLLQEAGFDVKTASTLADSAELKIIQNQIRWIEQRNASTNKLGLLRKAIEENFAEPQNSTGSGEGSDFIRGFRKGYSDKESQWLSPSPLENRVATEFSQKLVEDFGGDAAEWGRDFGSFVKRELGNRHRSFEKTVRFQSEKFIAIQKDRISLKRSKDRQRAEDEALRRKDEQHRQWLEYVELEVEKTKDLHSKRFEQFEGDRAKEREIIANDPNQGGLFLVVFDRRDSFLESFAEQFSDIVLSEDKFIINVK